MAPSVSFSGCAFMYPYHLGVANYIAEHFDVSDLRSAGASGGFTGAVTLAADVTEEEHWECLQTAKELWASRLLGPFLIQTKEWMAPYYHVLLKHESALLVRLPPASLSSPTTKGGRQLVA
eukprot:gene1177-1745_t